MSFKTVVVLGGGPIGLMCAIEARQNFVKNVTIIEKRSGYTRTNVPTLTPQIRDHFKSIGVASKLWKSPQEVDAISSVAFSRIEEELWKRAHQVGVTMLRGYFLQGLMGQARKRNGRFKSINLTIRKWDEANKRPQSDEVGDHPGDNWRLLPADLLVVASGGGASSDPIITRKLGFEFEKLDAENYGAFGVFDPPDDKTKSADSTVASITSKIVGSKIAFQTPDHNYLLVTLQQITAKDYQALKKDLGQLNKILTAVAKSYQTSILGEIKEVQKNLALFEISVTRARQFYSPEYPAVLVGDAAVTPHPQTGTGIGTGFKGFLELRALLAALKGTHRSKDNRGAFMAFNARYDLHVSQKALEGTKVILQNLKAMLENFKREALASTPGSSAAFADFRQRILRTTEALITLLDIYIQRSADFITILSHSSDALPPDWVWNDTVGALWSEINSSYQDIQNLTNDYSLLEDRMEELEKTIKFK